MILLIEKEKKLRIYIVQGIKLASTRKIVDFSSSESENPEHLSLKAHICKWENDLARW